MLSAISTHQGSSRHAASKALVRTFAHRPRAQRERARLARDEPCAARPGASAERGAGARSRGGLGPALFFLFFSFSIYIYIYIYIYLAVVPCVFFFNLGGEPLTVATKENGAMCSGHAGLKDGVWLSMVELWPVFAVF